MSANAYREPLGIRRARKLTAPTDPGAPAVGRVVELPDGTRAVLIGQGTGDTWHGQRIPSGELLTLEGTRASRRTGARPFPVVGHYADADAVPPLELDGLDDDAPGDCPVCDMPPGFHVNGCPHIPGVTVAELLAYLAPVSA